MDDPALLDIDAPLAELTHRLRARSWSCELAIRTDDAGRAVLRLQPPGAFGDPARTVEVEVREFDQEAHFAYVQNSGRPIAPVTQLDRAVRAIVHVHGGTMPALPQVPDGLLAAFESLRSERGGRSATRPVDDEAEE
ncbi:hypothetical protein [Actinomadura sp. WAC 06369]|uniref:hypothetical protein n=1 Tax=Actinomadura sp. WAC 06369 TaxID=2203193 RepID=UPI000F7B2A2E|nr:hypothetical protein [Actinomadura sp. WAC 06369]RSN56602.1 hypothetical protein DMH08_25100 [Actinomadura sp. WAC 06369]